MYEKTKKDVEVDLHKDPRGQALMKIHDMTTDITDGFRVTDAKYTPLFEGYTAFESSDNSNRIYLIMVRDTRALLYAVEVPSVPKKFIFSPTEAEMHSYTKATFLCFKVQMDHQDDISYLLAQDSDEELIARGTVSPEYGESGEDFIKRNALWLANPVLN